MPRRPYPWFRADRNGWFVNKDGQRHFLGNHPPDAPAPRKQKGKWNAPPAIIDAFHELMLSDPEYALESVLKGEGMTVAQVFDKFLDWCQNHRAVRTFDWYRDHIQDFINRSPKVVHLPASQIRPYHVVEWADSHGEDWSPAYRKGGIIAIQRPFNWAAQLRYIDESPIAKVPKPKAQRRESVVTPEDFAVILQRFPEGDCFRDLLEFAWYTGCRPQEARHIEPRHVHLDRQVIIIPKEESKGKRRARVILLSGRALEIVTKLMAERTDVKLFLNEDGKPWKRFAIANRFDRLCLVLGVAELKRQGIDIPPLPRFNRHDYADRKEMLAARKEHQDKLRQRRKEILKLARQHSTKFAAYDLRHGFCQRKLEQGVNHLVVAELMGHATGQTVATTYSHMGDAPDHLRKALEERQGPVG
jgi:integrase